MLLIINGLENIRASKIYFSAESYVQTWARCLFDHTDVLDVRWHISANAKQWDACVNIAGATLKLDPNRPAAWIHRSFAWHKLKRTQEAFNNLLPVADRFPKVWTIPYNLACYCAQLGRLDESQEWLTKARVIDERTVKLAAVDDSDLKPLRDSLSGNLW